MGESRVPALLAEQSFRDGTEALSALLSSLDDLPIVLGVAELDGADIRTVYGNGPAVRLAAGWSPGLRSPDTNGDNGHAARLWLEHAWRSVHSGVAQSFEYEHHTSAGSRWMRATVAWIRDSGRDRPRVIQICEDVSEYRQATAALRESEAKLRSLVQNVPNAMLYQIVVDAAGGRHFVYVSDNVRRLHGCSPAEVIADPNCIYGQVAPEDRQRVHEEEEAAIRAFVSFSTEARVIDGKGGTRWSYFASSPRRLSDGSSCWDGVEVDITDLKRAEEAQQRLQAQLFEAQRVESLGVLAGGLAHEMNNVLTVVLGMTSVMARELAAGDPWQADLSHITAAARRGQDLVANLLGFARKSVGQRVPLSLNDTLTQLADVLARTLPPRVRVSLELEPELGLCHADATQLAQALMNLAANGRDAIAGEGTLRLRTANVHLAEGTEDGLPAGDYVQVAVSDDGHGMDEETRRRAVEPFYTTKAVGSGTGLGLSMVDGVVKQHGGSLSLESVPGRGTTVTILLPAAAAKPRPAAASPLRVAPRIQPLRVLIVDDEEVVRVVAARLLTTAGYQTLVAASGEQALEIFGREHGSIDVVLLDMSMPGMDGPACFERLHTIDATVPVLICTGYGLAADTDVMVGRGAAGVLGKPFSLDELCRAINEVAKRRE